MTETTTTTLFRPAGPEGPDLIRRSGHEVQTAGGSVFREYRIPAQGPIRIVAAFGGAEDEP
jgi:hypothetical protein